MSGENAILTIATQNDGDDHIALMPSGNVGVNRTDPSYKLDVNGSFRCSSVTTGTSFTNGNKYIYSTNEAADIGLWFGTPFNGTYNGASKSAIIADAHQNWSRHNLCFCLNTSASNSINASLNDMYMGLNWNGVLEVRKAFWGNETGGGHLRFRTLNSGIAGDQVRFDGNGYNYQSTNSGSWATSCDERIKEGIEEANYEICYENIRKLPLKRYKYKDGVNSIISNDKHRLGYIAQDVQKIFPKNVEIHPVSIYNTSNEVVEEITDCLSIDMEQIHLSLYGAFQHAVTKIEALEVENKLLHSKLARIEDRLMQHNI